MFSLFAGCPIGPQGEYFLYATAMLLLVLFATFVVTLLRWLVRGKDNTDANNSYKLLLLFVAGFIAAVMIGLGSSESQVIESGCMPTEVPNTIGYIGIGFSYLFIIAIAIVSVLFFLAIWSHHKK